MPLKTPTLIVSDQQPKPDQRPGPRQHQPARRSLANVAEQSQPKTKELKVSRHSQYLLDMLTKDET